MAASRAYDFINFQGYNYANSTTTPGTDVEAQAVLNLLPQILVKHLRVNADTANNSYTQNTFSSFGVDAVCLTSNSTTTTVLTAFIASLTNGCSAIEMVNEPNVYNPDPNYLTDIPSQASTLRSTYPSAVIYGPSIYPQQGTGNPAIQQAMAVITPLMSSNLTYWNTHTYTQAWTPETTGYGGFILGCGPAPHVAACGYYGSVGTYSNEAAVLAPSLSGVATEGPGSYGSYYNICPNPWPTDGTNVDLQTQQAYVQRGFMWAFMGGLKRGLAYKLVDDGGCNDSFGTYGIINRITNGSGGHGLGATISLNPKPSFTALAFFNQLLNDNGGTAATFTPQALSLSLSSAPTDVKDLLLAESDGSYRLIIWSSNMLWNPAANGSGNVGSSVAPSNDYPVLRLAAPSTVTVYTQTPGTGAWSEGTPATTAGLQLTVNQYPQIVSIIPSGSSATPQPLPIGISTPGPVETP